MLQHTKTIVQLISKLETSECQATMCHTTEFFNNLRTPPIQNNCVCDAYPGTTCICYPSHGSYLNFTADVYF